MRYWRASEREHATSLIRRRGESSKSCHLYAFVTYECRSFSGIYNCSTPIVRSRRSQGLPPNPLVFSPMNAGLYGKLIRAEKLEKIARK